MEDTGVTPLLKYKSRGYMDSLWLIDGDIATYNGYMSFSVSEFTALLNSFDMNATKVRKHWWKNGRKVPVYVVYSLRRFLSLPKFKFQANSCYNASP